MSMKNPPHPGRIVGDALECLGLSVARGAEALGVSRSQLQRVVRGDSAISAQMALRLETVIGSSVGTWLRAQAAYDEEQARRNAGAITKGLARISA